MNFQETEAYLLSLGNEVETMKLGLESIRTLLHALGDPQHNYRKVQVAGTNGKGSVCAFLDSICLEAGVRTGVYTSPHLVSITERIRINGEDLSKEEFARFATEVRKAAERLVGERKLSNIPTFFEQVTAICLLAFANACVELAILETGLGGRFDATTAANAEIAVLTRIDLDHQEYLGETIEEIAGEKAAIIRSDSQVIVGEQTAAAMNTILKRCANVKVSPVFARHVMAEFGEDGMVTFSNLPPVKMGLAGLHQIENAKTAFAAARMVGTQLQIEDQHIARGLSQARHAGRLERMGRFLLDGAHNPSGARALRAFLDEHVNEPITLLFGSMKEKDARQVLNELVPAVEKIIFTRPENSRAMTSAELITASSGLVGARPVTATDSVKQGLDEAQKIAGRDGIIVVTGSLYLVGEVKKLLNN